MDDIDKDIIESLAAEGMGAHVDAVYTPPDGGDPVEGVYVIVRDLSDPESPIVVQGGAVLSILRSQVDVAVSGGTVLAGGTTWTIGRRLSTTDPSMIDYEAKR